MVNGTELITARGISYNDHVFFCSTRTFQVHISCIFLRNQTDKLLISRSGILYSLIFVQLVNKFLTIYESQFITTVTIVPQWSIHCSGRIMSTYTIFLRSILILSSHLYQSLSSGFPFRFPESDT
jgi:hypothetical protein